VGVLGVGAAGGEVLQGLPAEEELRGRERGGDGGSESRGTEEWQRGEEKVEENGSDRAVGSH
jgi:hypothetical protein